MAKYDVKFSCGHTEVLQLFGPTKERERKIAFFEQYGTCSECHKREQEEKREREYCEAQNRATEMDLPEMVGSEKQIRWATTLRDEFFKQLDEKLAQKRTEVSDRFPDKLGEFEIESQKLYLHFANKKAAKWWIDGRDDFFNEKLKNAQQEIAKAASHESVAAKAAIDEATIYPADQATKDVAEIREGKEYITLHSPKNEIIRTAIKGIGWRWDGDKGAWVYKLGVTTGDATDRMAETGNLLLNVGVPVRIFDGETRRKAVSGEYEPQHNYWIVRNGDMVKAKWKCQISDDLFKKIKLLPHAKYKDGGIVLDAKYYEEIRDFAKIYDFHISVGAEQLLTEAEQNDKAHIRVNPARMKNKEKADGKALKEILNSPRDVLDDLREVE